MTEDTAPASPSSRRSLLAVGALALAAGAGWNAWRHQTAALDPGVLKSLWDAQFEQADGSLLQLSDFQGKPLVLNFWATWCTPCVEEMPLLNAFYQQNKAKSWQMLGLAIDQPSAVKRFLVQHPVEYPIGLAGLNGTELMKTLGNEAGGLPFTLVLDAQSIVQMRKLGKLTASDIQSWA
jgi:thiol-disulfide isomerase/thioredoxin